MADFLDEKRKEIRARLQELKPLVDEYHRLEAAVQALEGVKPATATPSSRRSRSTSTRTAGGTGRRGRPRGSGTRSKEALALVRSNPGITIPELADKMGIKQNYLYRVLPGLQKDGMVRKQGRGWHARDAA
jgi:sugar-specific transcriptional regulator TrmB